jgi:cell division protein FtsL
LSRLIVPLYVVGLCTTFLLERRAGLPNLDSVDDAAQFIGFGAFAVVGALLVAKRPTNVIGWIMAVVALLLMAFRAGGAYAAYVVATRGQPDALAVFGAWIGHWAWGFILALTVIYLPLLFPDGKLPSRRWLLVAVLGGIGTLALVVLSALTDTLSLDAGGDVRLRIENPIGIEGLGLVDDLPIFGVLNGLLLVGVVGAGVSVVVRFRRSREVERQQMKWFVYAAALILLAPVVNFLPEVVNGVWFALVLIATSTAIGIAVLRYRLYEIDLIINRTLVYGLLTVTLIVIYIGGVVSLQYALRALIGQESQLAVVASTLAIAALFNPLRRRVQGFVDRRFYRRKYDAAKTMARFSSKLRDETDLETLREDLIGVVRETMQPAHVSLWLRPDTVSKKNGVSG